MENKNVTRKVNIMSGKKYLSRIAGILGGLIIFAGIVNVLNFMYVDNVDEVNMKRILWHNFYEDKGKIDNLYLGSSHVYCDINTLQLDKINGQYNFNMACGSQRLNASYYLLKEADKYNTLSHVYLDMYYTCNAKSDENQNIEPIYSKLYSNWQNTDYMKFSLNKLEYMFSIAGPEKYIDIILPFTRYRSQLDDWDYIIKNIEEKTSDKYLAYEIRTENPDGTYIEYMRQGYYYSSEKKTDEKVNLLKATKFDDKPLGEKSTEYLYKIISYCKKRNIPLTIIATPVNDFQLINIGNYDNYSNQIREIAEECGVDFYDFNLIKEEYLSFDNLEHFRDFTHLNDDGAALFTDALAMVAAGSAADNEKYFYSSYVEKLQSQSAKLYGIFYDYSKEIKKFWIASNREEGMEYKVIMTPNEGAQYVLQDFAQNKEFTAPPDEKGTCTIIARTIDNPDEVQTIESDY